MMDTVLNLGLNDESVEGLAKKTENERFAWDSLPALRADVRERLPRRAGREDRGRDQGAQVRAPASRRTPTSTTDDLKGLVDGLQGTSTATRPTRTSRRTRRSSSSRRSAPCSTPGWARGRSSTAASTASPTEWGTAVNVQQMVFGNKGDSSCSGVAFSRDEITGATEPSGDFLVNAQGEDVVSGVRTPEGHLRDEGGDARGARDADGDPAHARGPLQGHAGHGVHGGGGAASTCSRPATPSGPAQAAVRFAVEAVGEGLLTRRRRSRRSRRTSSTPSCTRPSAATPTTTCSPSGVPASPGRREGRDRLHGRGGGRGGGRRQRRGARAAVHRGRGRGRLLRRQGHPHERGRQGEPRGARGARDGPPGGDRRERARDRPRPAARSA